MTGLGVFEYSGRQVRTFMVDGEPWFVLRDVLDVLGIVRRPAAVVERLDSDEVRQTYLKDALGRQQETYIVSEPGLYDVIVRSDSMNVKPFRRWVTHEVLPQIRG